MFSYMYYTPYHLCHLLFNITLQKEEEKRDDHLLLIYALTEMGP